MKRILFSLGLLYTITGFTQSGYEIKVTFKPFKNQYIYLGHYFGKTYPIVDSAKLNDKSEAVFRGRKKLNGGIYLIGYPNKTGFFEILIDKQQEFSILADTATIKNGVQFVNSPDNVLFSSYQRHMTEKGKQIAAMQQQLKMATNKKDSAKAIEELTKLDKAIAEYRSDLVKKDSNNILSALLMTMKEPQLSGKLKNPQTKADSLEAYTYYKEHYWDGVNFWDGRLAYTTFFSEKLEKYYRDIVMPDKDSVIKEIDWMLGYASISEEMTRFLLTAFANRYLNQKYMWEDAVFVHLFEKYFAGKEYSWLNSAGKKIISDRAYSMMANLLGNPAPDISLPDIAGKPKTLSGLNAEFTLVTFWDATCGHCKAILPKLDSLFHNKWEAMGLKIFAISKETDGTKADWMALLRTIN